MLCLSFILSIASAVPSCPAPEVWLTDKKSRTSRADREEYRERLHWAIASLGASKEAGAVIDSIAQNESHFDPCSIHRMGVNEDGLGMVGLQTRFHRSKWDEDAPLWMFRLPEHSAIVTIRFMRRSVAWGKAKTWLDFLFWYRGYPNPAGDQKFCDKMEARGFDCESPISGLGTKLGIRKHPKQQRWLMRLLKRAARRP